MIQQSYLWPNRFVWVKDRESLLSLTWELLAQAVSYSSQCFVLSDWSSGTPGLKLSRGKHVSTGNSKNSIIRCEYVMYHRPGIPNDFQKFQRFMFEHSCSLWRGDWVSSLAVLAFVKFVWPWCAFSSKLSLQPALLDVLDRAVANSKEKNVKTTTFMSTGWFLTQSPACLPSVLHYGLVEIPPALSACLWCITSEFTSEFTITIMIWF